MAAVPVKRPFDQLVSDEFDELVFEEFLDPVKGRKLAFLLLLVLPSYFDPSPTLLGFLRYSISPLQLRG